MDSESAPSDPHAGLLRRVRFPAQDQIELTRESLDTLAPGPDQVLVRNLYCLISAGTELSVLSGQHVGFKDPDNKFAKYPFLPGYAAVGVVVEGGAGRGLEPGSLVYNEGRHASHELIDLRRSLLLPVAAGSDPRLVPFARLAQIASTAVHAARVAPGARVLVVGQGLVGNLAAQLFQRAGAEVTGCEVGKGRLQAARRCGIAHVLAGGTKAALAMVDAGRAERWDIVVESTGSPAAVADCLRLTRSFGTAILLGSTRGTVELDVYATIHRTGIKVTGAHVNLLPALLDARGKTLAGHTADLLEAIAAGEIAVLPLLGEIIRPEDAATAYMRLRADATASMGVLIDWQAAEG